MEKVNLTNGNYLIHGNKKIFDFVVIYNLGKNYTNPLNHFCDFVVWNKLVKEKKKVQRNLTKTLMCSGDRKNINNIYRSFQLSVINIFRIEPRPIHT